MLMTRCPSDKNRDNRNFTSSRTCTAIGLGQSDVELKTRPPGKAKRTVSVQLRDLRRDARKGRNPSRKQLLRIQTPCVASSYAVQYTPTGACFYRKR